MLLVRLNSNVFSESSLALHVVPLVCCSVPHKILVVRFFYVCLVVLGAYVLFFRVCCIVLRTCFLFFLIICPRVLSCLLLSVCSSSDHDGDMYGCRGEIMCCTFQMV